MVKSRLNIFESDPDFGGLNQLIESTLDWDVKNSTWTGCHKPEREFSVILQCQEKLLHFPNENIYMHVFTCIGFPGCSVVKNLSVQKTQDMWVQSLGWEGPLEEEMASHLPEKSHGQRSLAGYSSWGYKKLDTTLWLSTHVHVRIYIINRMCGLQILMEPYWLASGKVQFSSVQPLSHVWLCDPMNCSKPGLPIHHQMPEYNQTHVHWVSDAIQPSHPLSSPFSPTFDLSQHQGLFKWFSSSHQVAKVLEVQLQHQFFQWTPRTDLL